MRNTKYIIRRVIVSVLVALILSWLSQLNVFAASYSIPPLATLRAFQYMQSVEAKYRPTVLGNLSVTSSYNLTSNFINLDINSNNAHQITCSWNSTNTILTCLDRDNNSQSYNFSGTVGTSGVVTDSVDFGFPSYKFSSDYVADFSPDIDLSYINQGIDKPYYFSFLTNLNANFANGYLTTTGPVATTKEIFYRDKAGSYEVITMKFTSTSDAYEYITLNWNDALAGYTVIPVYMGDGTGVTDEITSLVGLPSSQDKIADEISDLKDGLTSNDGQAQNDANSFITSGDGGATGGLSGFVTSPLVFINAMVSSNGTCSPLVLEMYKIGTITIPCVSGFLESNFGPVVYLYQTIISGYIGYWVGIDLLRLIKNMRDPNNNEIEVMNL